jgi:hypothetical protein
VNIVVIVWALALLAACVTLLFHPLLKYLGLSEVPGAVLVCLCGRRYRRALVGILARRRLAARAPLLRPEKVKLPGPVTAGLLSARLVPAAVPTDWAALEREAHRREGTLCGCSRCEWRAIP